MEKAQLHRPSTQYLSESQTRRLHEAGLEILEQVGVYLYEQESIELYRKAGARIEEDGRVYIPAKLVEWALTVAPKMITLYDRSANPVMPLGKNQVYFGPGSDCLYVLDHQSGERRLGTLSDVEQIIRVCDALPHIDFLMSACVPSDVPAERANHRQMLAMIENSIKPIMFVTNDFDCSLDVVKAAEIVAGGGSAHRDKPYVCCYINVTDPLRHNDESLQKLLFFAEKGVPTTYTPMVLRGVNGPVTRAGAIALANAGELVGLVLAQLKREGAPIIHSGGYGDGFDMRHTIGVYAGPESNGGRPALASFYGLPIFGLGGASDSKLVDGQAVAESAFSLMAEALGGVNLVHDVGYLESGKCYSLEHLVICNELIGYIRRFTQEIEVSDETLALDVIAEQGPHGEYLGTEHTVDHYKQDWNPELFDRNNYDGWAAEGGKSLHDRAVARVDDILTGHRPESLNHDIREQVAKVLE